MVQLSTCIRFFLLLIAIALGGHSWANGVWIRPLPMEEEGVVKAWVGWQNGWDLPLNEGPGNRDGVWIFMKLAAANKFQHIRVVGTRILEGSFTAIQQDDKGVLIATYGKRSFGRDSCLFALSIVPTDLVGGTNELYAIEMAYVPAGSFYVGDSISNAGFNKGGAPYLLSSEDALEINARQSLQAARNLGAFTLGGMYPKGVAGFWAMKYEIAQSQIADFFNSIGKNQTETLLAKTLAEGAYVMEGGGDHRIGLRFQANNIIVDGNGNSIGWETDDGASRACGGLSWDILCAWLDWAALRPMSELEYEKMARGPSKPIAREFAWGPEVPALVSALKDDGTLQEGLGLQTPLTNAVFGGQVGQSYLAGPARVGFAAGATSDRIQAGCGYYGHFELSGNVWEQTLAVHPDNAMLDRTTGDGQLGGDGHNNNESWRNARYILRGGGWDSLIFPNLSYPFRDLAISDRYYQNIQDPSSRRLTVGGRGVK